MPWRALSLIQRNAAGSAFALAMALLLAVFGLSFRNTEGLIDDAGWRQHTYQVIAEIRGLQSALIDAETGERGYLLTGDGRFLEPYRAGSAEVPARIARLRSLTADNPSQQRRLDAFLPAARAELTSLAAAIGLRRSLGAATESPASALESKRRMDGLRVRLTELEAEESRLLSRRDRAMLASVRRADLSLLAGAAVGTLLLAGAFVALRREIGQRRQAEQAMRRLNARLEVANGELESFSYSVAHDLRAPLRAIDGFSHALLEDAGERLTEGDREQLGRVRSAARRMADLIDDLLRLSRLSRLRLEPRDVNLSAVAGVIAKELRSRDPSRSATVAIQPDLRAVGDERLLRVALENLLGNAWKFTRGRAQARIEFGAERGDGQRGALVYFVRDNGAGFDMAYADKLFGAFQRLHSAREFEGSGIGLATVARVVHIHGGRIWAEAAVDQGATFRFTLVEAAAGAPEKGKAAR